MADEDKPLLGELIHQMIVNFHAKDPKVYGNFANNWGVQNAEYIEAIVELNKMTPKERTP
ncbi:hypothetical protein EVC30_090 [Rhizobium phage RHph_Y1_11]|nr:hypothetical protein EVC30_090 [Rhizobium phage RHph_Y1_11]